MDEINSIQVELEDAREILIKVRMKMSESNKYDEAICNHLEAAEEHVKQAIWLLGEEKEKALL